MHLSVNILIQLLTLIPPPCLVPGSGVPGSQAGGRGAQGQGCKGARGQAGGTEEAKRCKATLGDGGGRQ